MYDHMVLLIKHRAMQATDISAVFASLLIAEDSPYEEKVGRKPRSLDLIHSWATEVICEWVDCAVENPC